MRKLGVLIAAIALASCDGEAAVSEEHAALLERVAKERELRVEAQARWEALTKNGQGCPGRILRDRELQRTVAGKHVIDAPIGRPAERPVPAPESRDYYPDGRLVSTVYFADPTGRYWIEGDKLCHQNLHGMGDIKWCLRLIESRDKHLMEEVMDERDPNQLGLRCKRIRLEELPSEP